MKRRGYVSISESIKKAHRTVPCATNGDRVIKTMVQIGGAALGIGVGCLASAAFAACASVPAAGVVAFAGVTILGTWIIDVASDKIYETVGIE